MVDNRRVVGSSPTVPRREGVVQEGVAIIHSSIKKQ